ncbi:MAG: porin family protein [Clostridium sp.]|nr:porin family protein [Clostridium sp.]
MKISIKQFLLIAAGAFAALCSYAQKHTDVLDNGFSVEVYGLTAINEDKERCHPYGAGLSGGYQWYLVKGLYLQPSAHLFLKKRYTDHYRLLGAEPRSYSHKEYCYGLSLMVGYSFPIASSNSLSVFTGYKYSYAFHVEEKLGGIKREWDAKSLSRLQPYWKLGVQFNLLQHYYANASMDFALKNRYASGESFHQNLFAVGIGYKF